MTTFRSLLLIIIFIAAAGCSPSGEAPATQDTGSMEFTNSPVVEDGAVMQLVSTGHTFTEGPVYDASGTFYFSDMPYHTIIRIAPDGTESSLLNDSGDSNGLYFTPDGILVACLSGDRMVVSVNADGSYTILADSYNGKRLNCCNDLWIDANGGIYFTDPAYNIRMSIEQDAEGVYYIPPDRSTLIRVADDLTRPNGIIGSPDGSTLYVADLGAGVIYRYAIQPDGTLADKTLFVTAESDGMTLDEMGNLYCTIPGIRVYSPEGTLIETIDVPETTTNVTFGGPDNRTLYTTAGKSAYSLRMKVAGGHTPRPGL